MNEFDLNEKENKLITDRFAELKTERSKYISRFRDIQNLVAITNEINSEFEDTGREANQKDIFINNPTAFICTNQAGDYLAGILWGLNAITLEPSEYIKKISKGADLSQFYKKATEVTLEQMNAVDAGFQSVLKSYCYDQFSYGTSGIGAFKSKEFERGQTESCISYKSFGVWNSCIDEGAGNKIDVVYAIYNWRLNQIIEEFCFNDKGEFDKTKFADMPEEIQQAYEQNKFNQKFKIVFAMLPNNHFCMNKRGKVGAKFKGYWFLENADKKVFKVEYFKKMPIAMCRQIRVNNQVYGESAGSLCLSSIKMLNHISGNTVDNIEKTTDAPLGILSGALVAGNVINRSAGAVTEFNVQAVSNNQNPIFPISQAGDISAVVQFLIPELKKDITNIFKIDQLLDFNNQTSMTATESSYRMSIRGKSINGLLNQQKTEEIEPIVHRSIQIIQDCGLYGYKLSELPENTEEDIAFKEKVFKDGDFIPEIIEQAMKDNKLWYKLKFNGELEKLCNSEIYENIGKFLQYIQALLQIKPELVNAVNDYEFLDLVKSVSGLTNDKLIKSKYQYEEILAQMEEIQQQQAQQQAILQQVQMMKDGASISKDMAQTTATTGE
ncbi:MAG: portal protein [Candidatus Gastranaerophilales bacterium]|nr:portal protein [Candidatus Gastranaerophilales bacterium]